MPDDRFVALAEWILARERGAGRPFTEFAKAMHMDARQTPQARLARMLTGPAVERTDGRE